MKKSKIIIPAMAVLVLSSAAAVSGTVAWFTAGRNAQVGVTQINVINPEGNMSVTVTPDVACTKTKDAQDAEKTTENITVTKKLRDASLNIDGGAFTAYRSVLDVTGTAVESFKVITNPAYSDEITYYVTWSVNFTMNDASASKTYDLFFDAASTFTPADNSGNEIFEGIRFAFYTANSTVVFAPNRPTPGDGVVTSISHVNGTALADTTTYTNVKEDAIQTVKESSYANAALARGDNKWLATINSTTSVAINCVMWLEGTDAAVDNDNLAALATKSASADLKFNAIESTKFSA